MTFSRVKPAGYALGEEVSGAQLNQLDIDHANSLDKTGDTLNALVSVGAAGEVRVNAGGKISVQGSGIIEVDSIGGLRVTGNPLYITPVGGTYNQAVAPTYWTPNTAFSYDTYTKFSSAGVSGTAWFPMLGLRQGATLASCTLVFRISGANYSAIPRHANPFWFISKAGGTKHSGVWHSPVIAVARRRLCVALSGDAPGVH